MNMNIEYPQSCREQGVVGRVYIKFSVNKLGQIVDPYVLYSSGRKLLDDEALRAIKSISEPVKVPDNEVLSFILPVDFNLDNILQYRLEQNIKKSNKYSDLAEKDLKNKKYTDAKSKYIAALNLNPGNVNIINKLGLIYYKLNQNDSVCYFWKEKRIDFSSNSSDTLIKKYCSN